MAKPISGTLAERYLAGRGIMLAARERTLRFHPGCYYRDHVTGETLTLPALIAAVTGFDGRITGLQRTWLDPGGNGKAHIAYPRRSLGCIFGNGNWLGLDPGMPVPVMAAGEGFETMASLRTVMPALPVAAATSANHLAGLTFPPACRRLYIAADADAAAGTASSVSASAPARSGSSPWRCGRSSAIQRRSSPSRSRPSRGMAARSARPGG
nr:toprim domain-containing protein [Mesorhizobium sp.]